MLTRPVNKKCRNQAWYLKFYLTIPCYSSHSYYNLLLYSCFGLHMTKVAYSAIMGWIMKLLFCTFSVQLSLPFLQLEVWLWFSIFFSAIWKSNLKKLLLSFLADSLIETYSGRLQMKTLTLKLIWLLEEPITTVFHGNSSSFWQSMSAQWY